MFDLSKNILAYVQENRSLLPETVEDTPFNRAGYKLRRDSVFQVGVYSVSEVEASASRCDVGYVEDAFSRALCSNALRYGELKDLFNAARQAGVTLP